MAIASRIWLVCMALALGCLATVWASHAQAASGKLALEVNGIKRTAVIVEHARLKKARRALVIVLHGGNKGTGTRIRKNLGLDDIFAESGAVLVYPDAHEGHWTIASKPALQNEDFAFFRAIISQLSGQGIIDARRVFLVGSSLGGVMAMRVACDEPELFAGFATMIANMPTDMAASCKPAKPMPLMMINGTADPRMPYKGGETSNIEDVASVVSTEETIKIFAAAAACPGEIREISFPNRNPKSGSRAFLDRYEDCRAPVELVRIEGGGHTLPGRWNGNDSGAVVGSHNSDVDSARLIYDFFRKLTGA